MRSEYIVSDADIAQSLSMAGFDRTTAEEGRLMLAELMLKAGAGFRSSHTEEIFLGDFKLLKKDRTPNKKGRKFLCSMLYTHSNGRPDYYKLMQKYRRYV